jgi:hypothetical protein
MAAMTVASHTAPEFSALFAVNMALTSQEGRLFSDTELSKWLTNAGFHDIELKPLLLRYLTGSCQLISPRLRKTRKERATLEVHWGGSED